MLKNSLFQPSLSFSFSAAVLFLFLFSAFFCFSAAPLFLFLPAFLFFSVHVCPFFQPKTILSSAPKHFFQPKTFFSSAHTTVSASFCFVSAFFLFVGFVFSAPFLFCVAPPFLLSFSAPHSLFLANFQGQKYSL